MIPESWNSNTARQVAKGYQSITTVPGLGSIASRMLFDHQVRNLADLARLDPYDDRFTKLGEDFPRWVLHARNLVADEVIMDIEVRKDVIIVSTAKTYDKEATLKSVLGRLGVYYIYVDSEVREKGEEYEISIRLKPEQYAFAQAQWNEYRANASLLQELKRKVVTPKWKTLKYIDDILLRTFTGPDSKDFLLFARICLRAQLVRAMNILVFWDTYAVNKVAARLLAQRIVPRMKYIALGDGEPERLEELILSCKEGTLLMIDDWERAKGDERRAVLEALAYPKVIIEGERWSNRASMIINCWSKALDDLTPDMLGLFDLAFAMPRKDERSRLIQLPESLNSEDTEVSSIEKAITEVIERGVEKSKQIQNELQMQIEKFSEQSYNLKLTKKANELLKGFSPDISQTAGLFALAESRLNLRDRIEVDSFKESFLLIKEAIATLDYLSSKTKGKKMNR